MIVETPGATLDRIRAELPGYGYTDCLRHLPAARQAAQQATPLRVAVLRSYTVEPIAPVLELRLLLDGFRSEFWFGGYNQYVQDVVDPGSALHEFRPDLILLMLRVEEVLPDFMDDFAARPVAEWEARVADSARDLGALIGRIEQTHRAQVVVQNLALSHGCAFGILDAQRPLGQGHLVQRFNQALATELAGRSTAFVWDFEAFVRAYGYDRLHDPKMWYVSRNPYRQSAYPAIADDLARYIRAALGRVTKCIVLDLDGTLWGGIAGEDGLEGIALGHAYPGNCFRDFQRQLLMLHNRGILLAINSKNNDADALRIIDEHPDMVLRRPHFAAMRINWRDKASNLRGLARELDIGLDSCVVLDDNPVECELMRRECPECQVVVLPGKPYLLPDVPRRLPFVETVRLTEEDRRKGEMYRTRAERREHEARYTDLDEFLRTLEMEVTIEPASPFTIPRIAQLTQKTNQMNLTTRRYTEAAIMALAGDPDRAVYSVSSRDRFGDDGIVGVLILVFDGSACRIDTLLLSCRVIGRGIERLMVSFAAQCARRRDASALIGEFLPTAKNKPAADVYERLGFARTAPTMLSIDLRQAAIDPPAHIRVAGWTEAAAV